MANRLQATVSRGRGRRVAALAVSMVVLVAAPVLAIEVMRVEVQFLDAVRGDASQHALLTIAPQLLRIDQYTNVGNKPPHTLIYRGDRDVILSIDGSDQAYIEVDRGLIAAFGLERAKWRNVALGALVLLFLIGLIKKPAGG